MRGEPVAPPAPEPMPEPAPATPLRYVTSSAATPPAPAPAPKPAANVLLEGLPRPEIKLPKVELPSVSASDLVGARALAWIGGLVTLLGILFFFVLAVNRGWVSAELRTCLGALVSVGLYGAAWFVWRRYGSLYAALAAAGAAIGGAYATLVAATVLYDFVPQELALLAAAGIAAAGIATALAWDAELTAILGLAGAMLGPPLIENGDPSVAGAGYVAIMLAAAIALGQRRGWLATLAIAGAVSIPEVALLFEARDTGESVPPGAVAGVFALLYLAAAVVAELDKRQTVLPTVFLLGSLGVAAALVAQLSE